VVEVAMYPLEVVLFRCGEELLPQLRRELVRQHARIGAEFRTIRDLLASTNSVVEWTGNNAPCATRHLAIVHLHGAKDLSELSQLSSAMIDQPILALVEPGGDPQFLTQIMRE